MQQHPGISNCPKCLAEFAAEAANKIKILFGRGVYVDENTSQAASVEFVRLWRTTYARSRLQTTGGKAQRAFSARIAPRMQQHPGSLMLWEEWLLSPLQGRACAKMG